MIIQRRCAVSDKLATWVVELLYGSQITGKQSHGDIKQFVKGRC